MSSQAQVYATGTSSSGAAGQQLWKHPIRGHGGELSGLSSGLFTCIPKRPFQPLPIERRGWCILLLRGRPPALVRIGKVQRRSGSIPACAILLATAAGLSSCEERRDCVDRNGRKMPDSYCDSAAHTGGHFIYGGRGGRGYGDTVRGGEDSSSVSRGGFGEGGDGGGHGGGE